MKNKIDDLSQELYEKVLKQFLSNRDKALSEYLEKELLLYNDKVVNLLRNEVYIKVSQSILETDTVATLDEVSKMLNQIALSIHTYIKQLFNKKGSFSNIFNYLLEDDTNIRDEYVTKMRTRLPKYMDLYLRKNSTKNQIEKEISKIKTKNLKIAYKKVVELAEKHNKKAVQRALKYALQEKSRYYATRVAVTEGQRVQNMQRAKKYFDDKNIEFVKYQMSSLHPQMDICDFYANLDIGYGKGIVPKEKMINVPLHPHCMCRYIPYYQNIKETKKQSLDDNLKRYTKDEQKYILGGEANLEKWRKSGDVTKVINSTRENKYKIVDAKNLVR